ncbi:HK97 gp10 family phage protein [Streptomyces sp. NBC_01571]|uniref:HK97-gp10 family putative phage morphogenesis protein n=1 Tax=Streptomyces sp. NBC_01571 TaxID=2975883 RepID=UPI00224FC2FF|nr:HK97-gp10 family putative phage morphogenesis protein [Streptomyces sp. NBC_01571]MCX4572287.1 HK97 gp10 family phage protein [Streptomyces sp. NBC_01571]
MASSMRGLRTALARLRLLPVRVNEARADALRDWAQDLEKTAKELAPVRKGTLRDSIEAKVNASSGKAWVQIAPGKARKYAYYVEKGTSKMADQPFLGPAAQIHRRTGERAMQRAARRRLGRW